MAITDLIINNMMNDPRYKNNQLMQNAFDLYRKGDIQGLEQLTRNACNEKGQDINAMMYQAQKMFGSR